MVTGACWKIGIVTLLAAPYQVFFLCEPIELDIFLNFDMHAPIFPEVVCSSVVSLIFLFIDGIFKLKISYISPHIAMVRNVARETTCSTAGVA